LDKAIAELQKALAINPSFAKAHLMLGIAYLKIKRRLTMLPFILYAIIIFVNLYYQSKKKSVLRPR
jgi:hypothetical protein